MNERATTEPTWPLVTLRIGAVIAGTFVVVAAAIAFAIGPYLFKSEALQGDIVTQIRATTGLVLSAQKQAAFQLLPSPRVTLASVRFDDSTGTLIVEAEALVGNIRILPLIVGRLELSSATLQKPKLTIDLDGRPMPPDSTIGRLIRAGKEGSADNRRLGIVTLEDGSAVLKSRAFAHPQTFDDIDVTIDWRKTDSPATLTGTMKVRGTAADVAVWIAQPSSLARGDHSAVTLRIHSVPVDLSANGDIVSTDATSFRGRLSVDTPSIQTLFALDGYTQPLPAPFANLALTSDAIISLDHDGLGSADLPSLKLRVDGNDYEGTLAYQGGPRPLLSGTLAVNQLVLTPFLYRAPRFVDDEHHWTRTPLSFSPSDGLGLDLRISASHLRLAPIAIDDAALAVMTRESRIEIGLVEGKAYGGILRGRLSFGRAAGGLNVRGVGSITNSEASTLSWDAFGRQIAAGTVTGSANFETTGDSPATLMEHLQGSAKGTATDGEISGIDLAGGLRDVQRRHFEGIAAALKSGRTPFNSAYAKLRVSDGVVTIDDANLKGNDAVLTLIGKADLGERLIRLNADAKSPEGDDSGNKPPSLRFNITGSFDQATVAPDLSNLIGPRRQIPQ